MSTREAIIEAATRLYAEKGYEGMTLKEIANEVGIKAPSVYAFFKNKEDVFLHIYQGILSGHLQLATDHAQEFKHITTKEQLDRLLRAVMEYQLREAMQMKIMIRLLLFPPDFLDTDIRAEFLEVEQQETRMLSAILKRGMDNGEIREADSDELARLAICVMDGLFWQMQRCEPESFYDRFEIVWRQFWASIKK